MQALIRFALSDHGAAALSATLIVAPVGAQYGQIAVQLNGTALSLHPTPIVRAGRVFVPLRGVFERMGATVVYDNGQINATDRGHTVSVSIGSTRAIVDGRAETLDVAPFIIGASSYVPLRFLSQSLGAQVRWDPTDDVVVITMGGERYVAGEQYGVGGAVPEQPAPQAYPNSSALPSYAYAPDYSYPGYYNSYPVYYPGYPVYYPYAPYACCYGGYYGVGIGIHVGGFGGFHGGGFHGGGGHGRR